MHSTAILLALALPAAPSQQAQRFAEDHAPLPWDDGQSREVLIVPVDGDAFPDVLLGGRLFRGLGGGAFAEVPDFPAFGFNAKSVAAGDLDGDLDTDIVIGGQSGAVLYLGDGAGGFVELPDVLEPSSSTESVALGDVDVDGDLDVFLAQTSSSSTAYQNDLFRNDGGGTFVEVTATALPAVSDSSRDAEMGDLDGDGDLDVFLTNGTDFGAADDTWLRNDGLGSFAIAASFPGHSGRDAALGDVDVDGDLDVLVGNFFENQLFLNDGAGGFADVSVNLPAGTILTRSVALADLDGDADLDAVIGTQSELENQLLENDGAGFFTDVPKPFGGSYTQPAYGISVADVDLDGDADVAFANFGRQSEVFLNGGGLQFGAVPRGLPLDSWKTQDLAAGDLDGDGDLDAVAVNGSVPDGPESALVYANDGRGAFTPTTDGLPSLDGDFNAVDLGDLDGDGDLDLALAAGGANPNGALLMNQGDGSFVDSTAQTPGMVADGREVSFGDADGDGDLDVFMGVVGKDRYWFNDGAGNFVDAPASYVITSALETSLFEWYDLDADGVLEALSAGASFTALRLYENDGTGALTDAYSQLGGGWTDPDGIAVGDVDGDLDPDIVVASSSTYERLLINDGTAHFHATGVDFEYQSAEDVEMADFDLDGDLDVLFAADNLAGLYRNDGMGAFTLDPDALGGYAPRSSALLARDFDRDGDVDALFGNDFATNRVWYNRLRHLAWRSGANLGKLQPFDVSGPAGELWLVAFSPGQGALDLPPYGVLGLDPAAFLIVDGGALDGDGHGVFVGVVPNLPALVGGTYFWQALVGSAEPKLTNAQATTVTAF